MKSLTTLIIPRGCLLGCFALSDLIGLMEIMVSVVLAAPALFDLLIGVSLSRCFVNDVDMSGASLLLVLR